MDKEKLKAYGVDYENAVKRFAGNEALDEKFLKKLTEDDHLAIGEQAMKEERYEDVLEAVHALKGVAGTLGMTVVPGCRVYLNFIAPGSFNRISEGVK